QKMRLTIQSTAKRAYFRPRKLPSLERKWVVGQSLSNSLVQTSIQRNSSVSTNPTNPIHCKAEKTGSRQGRRLYPINPFELLHRWQKDQRMSLVPL
ncbi:MAG: hypothetical protein CO095_05695, partial [Armatimonadetes bacterium CG_4_9_14_3_um_filter_58_7]